MSFHAPEKHRFTHKSAFGTTKRDGNNGLFFIPTKSSTPLKVIASDGEGWEHVSVSLPSRCPTWEEMCAVKSLFWGVDDTVIQYHPPESEYVNNHPYCLHLWRPIGVIIPLPPSILVGIATPKITGV